MISEHVVHEGLVSEQDFIAVQAIRATRPTEDSSIRTYLLTGLLRCGICRRRMDAHWVHGRPGYRCRHGHTSARTTVSDRPKNLYIREDHVLTKLAELHADRDRAARALDVRPACGRMESGRDRPNA